MVVGVLLYLIFSLAPSYETALKIVSAVSCGIMAWFKLVPGAWFKALQWSGAEGTWAAQKEAKTEINRPSLALFAWGSKVKGGLRLSGAFLIFTWYPAVFLYHFLTILSPQ